MNGSAKKKFGEFSISLGSPHDLNEGSIGFMLSNNPNNLEVNSSVENDLLIFGTKASKGLKVE